MLMISVTPMLPPTVALWNPAYALTNREQVAAAITSAERFCQAIGGTLVVDNSVHDIAGIGAWAPAQQRRTALQRIMQANVCLAARGGYGCVDLLPELSKRTTLPYLIGYSDVTVLHAAWAHQGQAESLYGFMPGVAHGERALSSAVHNFCGHASNFTPTMLPECRPLHAGSAKGRLFTACLSVLAGLCGSSWLPNLHGAILCIEDIDERPYRLDRALWQLHANGCLSHIVGLISNGFPAPTPANYSGPSAHDIIEKWARHLQIPALFAFPFGHHPDPIALPCGRLAQLDVSENSWSFAIMKRHS
jgi:muramoyltetrapeptide carboxypeptidase